jgi:tetratricopeptide (TPR) repeat protein
MLRVFSRCLACLWLLGGAGACPEPDTAARLHGNVAARARRFAEARGAFEEAVRAVPTAPQNHVLLGNVLFALRSFPEAAAAWKNAISLDAQEPSARLGLARWAIQTGASAKALRELHALPASEQRTVGARCVSALALLARGLPGDAQEALLQARAALEVEPDSHDAAYLEGSSLLALSLLTEAQVAFEALQRRAPPTPLGSYGLARVAAAQGRSADAILHLQVARRVAGATWAPRSVLNDPAFVFLSTDTSFLDLTQPTASP